MSNLILFARKLEQGGAERQIVALAKELKKRGHEIHVVLFYAGGVFDSELIAAGVPLHYVRKQGRWDIIGFGVRLAYILRRLRPETIYSFLDLPNILAALLGRWVGRPRLVWGIRAAGMEMHHYDWLSELIPKLEARMSGVPDIVVANSRAGKEWAITRGFPQYKVVVIENGIDTDRFKFDPCGREEVRAEWKIDKYTKVIGLVGRLDPMKGHEIFLKAVARLGEARQNLMFVCVGGGKDEYAHRLRGLTRSLGLDRRVIWVGPRMDMPAVFSALDVVCSSSSFGEGFPNVIAEAMACERPCVVTDVGDSARIVGGVGEVVPPRDADGLAAALARMIDRIEKDGNIGRKARARILKEFSVEHMVSRTEQVVDGKH